MKDWYSTIYKAFILASLVSFLVGFFSQSQTSLGAYITGYSVLILGIMMILIILFNNILNITSNNSTLQVFYSIFTTAGPFILMLCVISFILYLIVTYKNKIMEGHVAPGYNTFSNIIILLLFIQIYLVYNNINNFSSNGKISRVTFGLIYLIGVLTAICSVIVYTNLKYYSTDGFTTVTNI